jgi:hypothetical protein
MGVLSLLVLGAYAAPDFVAVMANQIWFCVS